MIVSVILRELDSLSGYLLGGDDISILCDSEGVEGDFQLFTNILSK